MDGLGQTSFWRGRSFRKEIDRQIMSTFIHLSLESSYAFLDLKLHEQHWEVTEPLIYLTTYPNYAAFIRSTLREPPISKGYRFSLNRS